MRVTEEFCIKFRRYKGAQQEHYQLASRNMECVVKNSVLTEFNHKFRELHKTEEYEKCKHAAVYNHKNTSSRAMKKDLCS